MPIINILDLLIILPLLLLAFKNRAKKTILTIGLFFYLSTAHGYNHFYYLIIILKIIALAVALWLSWILLRTYQCRLKKDGADYITVVVIAVTIISSFLTFSLVGFASGVFYLSFFV